MRCEKQRLPDGSFISAIEACILKSSLDHLESDGFAKGWMGTSKMHSKRWLAFSVLCCVCLSFAARVEQCMASEPTPKTDSRGPTLSEDRIRELIAERNSLINRSLTSKLSYATDGRTSLQQVVREFVARYRIPVALKERSFRDQGITIHHVPAFQANNRTLQQVLVTLVENVIGASDVEPIVEVRDGVLVIGATLPWRKTAPSTQTTSLVIETKTANGEPLANCVVETKGRDAIYFTASDADGVCESLGRGITIWDSFARTRDGKMISYQMASLPTKQRTLPHQHVLRPATPLTVRVSDTLGKPIQGALVGMTHYRCDHAVSDATGVAQLSVTSNHPAWAKVFALKPGHAISLGDIDSSADDAKHRIVDVVCGKPRTVSIVAQGLDGKPLEKVALTPLSLKPRKRDDPINLSSPLTGIECQLTDPRGRASFNWLPENHDVVFHVMNDDLKHNKLEMTPEDNKETKFEIAGQVIVTGRVVDEKAQPVEGVRVTGHGVRLNTTTDDAGKYELRVPPGKGFYFEAFQGQHRCARSGWIESTRGQTHIRQDDLVLKSSARIFGQVTRRGDHKPASRMHMSLTYKGIPGREVIGNLSTGYGINSYADDDGRFEYFVCPGKYEVRTIENWVKSVNLDVQASEDYRADIVLPSKVAFRARIVSDNPPRLVPGAIVELRALADDALGFQTTANEGTVSTERDRAPGLIYAHNKDESIAGYASIGASETDVEISIAPTITLKGQLVFSDGEPVVNESMQWAIVSKTAGTEPGAAPKWQRFHAKQSKTDDRGEFELSDMVIGGPYSIEVGDYPAIKYSLSTSDAERGIKLVIPRPAGPALQAADNPVDYSQVSLPQTIRQLTADGNTEAAKFLSARQNEAFKQHRRWRDASFIFGRIVLSSEDNPRYCDAQMQIHSSGWFLGSVGSTENPVGFRMWGYHPVEVTHGGEKGQVVNVGEISMVPYRFDQLATVRGAVVFENDARPDDAEVRVEMEAPRTNSRSGGTNGRLDQPKLESVQLTEDLSFQKTGLTPIAHTLSIRAKGHLPLHRKFQLEPGGTTDLGILRVAAAPRFRVELLASDTTDFSKSESQSMDVHVEETFATRPSDGTTETADWVAAGELRLIQPSRAREGTFGLHCSLHGLTVVDLGSGKLSDFPHLAHPETMELHQTSQPLVCGNVYLIGHSYARWQHWTLLRVQPQPTH